MREFTRRVSPGQAGHLKTVTGRAGGRPTPDGYVVNRLANDRPALTIASVHRSLLASVAHRLPIADAATGLP
jgi:hypothetical protein